MSFSGCLPYPQCIEGRRDQGHFMRRSTRNPFDYRKTMAVRHCHEFGTLAAFGLPNARAPLLAPVKVPSMKASRMSSPPRSFKSRASVCSTRPRMPSGGHSWNRRLQVWYDGYWGGRSFHHARVFKIHSTPSSISRAGQLGRPQPGESSVSNSGWTSCHCASVSFNSTLEHNS
jgi:hypothetical protein